LTDFTHFVFLTYHVHYLLFTNIIQKLKNNQSVQIVFSSSPISSHHRISLASDTRAYMKAGWQKPEPAPWSLSPSQFIKAAAQRHARAAHSPNFILLSTHKDNP
jgi:hypothetical protein